MFGGCCGRRNNGYQSIEIEDLSSQRIDCEEIFQCDGFKHSGVKCFFFHLIAIAFVGIPYLFIRWYKQYEPIFKYRKCSLKEAEVLLVQDSNNVFTLEFIEREPHSQNRYFYLRCIKFVWVEELNEFHRLKGLDNAASSLSSLLDNYPGLSLQERHQMLQSYGENIINIEVKSYFQLFIEEVFNPFYLFQIFSIILWSLDDYYYYAGCVFFLSTVSIAASLYQTRKQSFHLKNLVAMSGTNTVSICIKDGSHQQVLISTLVPGDVLVIPEHGFVMPCDAVLLSGICIVNESMLTGESVPVMKTPPQHSSSVYYDPVIHKRHTLFGGTQVIQTRYYGNDKVSAVVVRTGFSTSKGDLVRSMLYPRPIGFKFYSDSIKFISVLFVLSAVGMGFSVYLFLRRQAPIEKIVLRTLDLVTIVVPPALPAAMTAGTVYSQNRLRKLGIFCISPPRIAVCGKLKLACFDKTGTLTEEGLDLVGVLPTESNLFTPAPVEDPSTLPSTMPLLAAMATCHSLTRIEGELTGDPLDLQMFRATNWELEEPGKDTTLFDLLTPTVVRPPANVQPLFTTESELPLEIGIMRQFAFSSNDQRMSVITRTLGASHMTIYCKGAPEKLVSLCSPHSIPADIGPVLKNYTLSGYRVIALAYKHLDDKMSWRHAQRITREKVETELEFLGLLIMQNMLKPETTPAITKLQLAKIRCVMITGDNLLTAVSVARECGMVQPSERVLQLRANPTVTDDCMEVPTLSLNMIGDTSTASDTDCVSEDVLSTYGTHLAMEGTTWSVVRLHYPHLMTQLCVRGTVFARMAPDNKTQLVEELQKLDYIVAMCGDGANDCGALKAAHIGVSLSDAEASVAAPFTSRVANISCILKLVQEGRCALVTSFGLFKYMASYSLIQFATVLILYSRASAMGSFQFLYIDLIITTSLAVVMGRTGPANRLVAQRPMGSLIAMTNLVPLICQIIFTVIFQIAALVILAQQPWFSPVPDASNVEEIKCWENTSVFCVSCYQYLILAAVLSKGKPHRKPQCTNGLFVMTILVLTMFTTLLTVYPVEPLASFFDLEGLESGNRHIFFRISLLLLPMLHLVIALLIETCVADTRWLKRLAHWLTRKKEPKNKYKRVECLNIAWMSHS